MALKKFCRRTGCQTLVDGGGYCEAHQSDNRRYDDYRGTAAERGYDHRWRKYRLRYLMANPLCVSCLAQGRVEAATDVDHIKAHKGDKKLFWDSTNHQSLCGTCHKRKTVREDGGFGNGKKSQ